MVTKILKSSSFLRSMPDMQSLLRSKILLLAVLSCSLIIALLCDNREELKLVSTHPTITVRAHPAVGNIWNSLGQELTLDHQVKSARVQAEIRKLLADRDELSSILRAASPYIYYIYAQTKKRGLPAELALIPFIESEFNPNDHSNKGALGLWQLLPGTARELGVKIGSGYDGRKNVVESTHAALAYFNDLGTLFNGNWYLAIAAYNCGQGKVQSSARRTGSHNFWNLPLPKETKYYVPKLLAIAEIVKNPEKYGVTLPTVNNQPYFSELKVEDPVNLTKIAKACDINLDTLHKLNPEHKGGVIPGKNHVLLVPTNKIIAVQSKLA